MGEGGSGVPTWSDAEAAEIVAACRDERGGLLVILLALQEAFGYLDERAVPLVAESLNLSRAEVRGVISFYADLRSEQPGRSVLRVCRAESCQALGAESLVARLEARLGIGLGATTPDGSLSIEQVFCLGNCSLSPAVQLDGRVVGRVDAGRLDALVDEALEVHA